MSISVIVPYNGENNYLADCLESLSEQTYKDFEIILVTAVDSVPDEVIGKYSDLNIIVEKVKDGNVSMLRNQGVKKASGEYVTYLDCDDYIDPDFLEKMIAATKNAGNSMVFGRLCYTWYSKHIHYSQEIITADKDDNEEAAQDKDKDAENEEGLIYLDYVEAGDDAAVIRKKRIDMAAHYLVSKRKSIRNITAVGNLYNKKYLIDNSIWFDENKGYLSDIAYIAKVIASEGEFNGDKSAVYVKRKHNDPIHQPSLSQQFAKDDFEYIYKSYQSVIDSVKPATDLKARFDRKLLGYLASVFAPAVKKAEIKEYRKSYMAKMGELLSSVDDGVYKEVTSYKRKLAKAVMAGDVERVCKLARNKNIRNMIVYSIKNPHFIRKSKDILYKHRYSKQPVIENLVLFESFFGKSYSDSPKYIFEKLNEMYPGKYECVWILEKKTKLPYPAKQIKRFSFAYYKYLARAKYIVFNSRQPKNFIKRKENIFLETWHGTPLKKLVYDMDEVVSASPLYKRNFYIQSRSWDYLIAANSFSDEVFKRAFDYDKPMLKYGYPRNDILHAADKEEIAKRIKAKIGIPDDKKIVLYAPTWRDDEYYEAGKYKFTLQLDLAKMRKELGSEYVVILRTHYFIADKIDITGAEDFVYNLSKYDDIAELYLISDILITDYSSVFFDYANLKRPILFFTYDLEKYRDVLRGFYIDMEKDIPGPLVYNTDEIIDSIKNIDEISKKYSDVYDVFYERFCGWEDGHASENCIKEVFKS